MANVAAYVSGIDARRVDGITKLAPKSADRVCNDRKTGRHIIFAAQPKMNRFVVALALFAVTLAEPCQKDDYFGEYTLCRTEGTRK